MLASMIYLRTTIHGLSLPVTMHMLTALFGLLAGSNFVDDAHALEWLGQTPQLVQVPFLLHPVIEGSIPAVAIVWQLALALWFDSTPCPGGCQRETRKS
jgi:hypothetical protein